MPLKYVAFSKSNLNPLAHIEIMSLNTTALLVVAGAAVLLIGLAGGYVSSLSSPEYFLAWAGVAFAGIIIALAGFALGSGKESKEK